MNMIDTIKKKYQQLQSNNGTSPLTSIEQNAFNTFNSLGIPTAKHEEWKYTRISSVLNKEYAFNPENISSSFSSKDLDTVRLPGYEQANELVFVNGLYSNAFSDIRSNALTVLSLEEATKNEYKNIVAQHLGHSGKYIKDGIHALNTAFLQQGIFIYVKQGEVLEHPVYIYNITDARSVNILSQPRSLIYIGENAQVQFVETYSTFGLSDSFTNEVM